MTVKEMLEIPSLSNLKLIAGFGGLENNITTVTVMDAPDIYEWIRGGEFLITSGYPIRMDQDYLVPLIEKLHEAKVGAFGIKFTRFFGDIYQSTIDAANKYNVPLIYISGEYAFPDIINPILYRIANSQTYELHQKELVHKAFFQDISQHHNEELEVLKTLESFSGSQAVFYNSKFQSYLHSGKSAELADLIRKDREKSGNSGIGIEYDRFPVTYGGESYGDLYVQKSEAESINRSIIRIAVDYATVLLALHAQSKLESAKIEERFRNEFLIDLFLNNIKSQSEIDHRAKLYGWDFTYGGVVLVADINNIKSMYIEKTADATKKRLEWMTDDIAAIALPILKESFPGIKYYKQSDHIEFLISLTPDRRKSFEEDLAAAFGLIRSEIGKKDLHTITFCVGSYKDSITNIHESYEEAHSILKMVINMQLRDSIQFYDKLMTHRLLSAIPYQGVTREFLDKYITPLGEYDKKHSTSFLKTAIACVVCGWNDKITARALYIHYNSLKYRIDKIEQLLGIDLKDHNERFSLELAVKLYQIYNNGYNI